jgi:transposase
MFVKLTKAKQNTYVQLIEGYREGKKVKHRVVANLGRLDVLQKDTSWDGIINKLSEIFGSKDICDIKTCKTKKLNNFGYLAYQKLWKTFQIEEMLAKVQKSSKVRFDFNSACFLMAVNHLINPSSKLGMYNNQAMYAKYQEVELNHLYRSLDILSKHKEDIERQLFITNCDLYSMQVDVAFYDVTTFHFESIKQDDLRDFGFSKANKINEVQVVLGMLTDCEGRPIGYELFPGKTYEGKTLESALKKIKQRFGIRNVTIVADKGINSKTNLKQIVDNEYGYIVASRIKNLKQSIQQQIFDPRGYQALKGNDVLYKVIDYTNTFKTEKEAINLQEKLIITYSAKRAEKDRRDRKRLVEKARHLLANKSLIKSNNKRGGKKYLKETGATDWILDQEALTRDAMFDGYYAIQTSEQNLSVEKILDAYHSLWKIEESFRIMKSTLEVRPIFHWTERRIKGHFVICFLAFLLERTMEIELRKAGYYMSVQDIRNALNSMQFAEVQCNTSNYFLTAPINDNAAAIFKALKMKLPANSGSMDKFNIEKIIF